MYSGEIPEDAYGFKVNLYFLDGDKKVNVYYLGSEFNSGVAFDKNDIMLNNQDICYQAYGNMERQLKRLGKKKIINDFYFEIEFAINGGENVTKTLRLEVTPVKTKG